MKEPDGDNSEIIFDSFESHCSGDDPRIPREIDIVDEQKNVFHARDLGIRNGTKQMRICVFNNNSFALRNASLQSESCVLPSANAMPYYPTMERTALTRSAAISGFSEVNFRELIIPTVLAEYDAGVAICNASLIGTDSRGQVHRTELGWIAFVKQ
jgi:hypothetical protein